MTLNDPYPWFQGHDFLSLILNISETVRDTDIVSMEYQQGLTYALLNCVISNDLE